ncbi:sulfotransferase [Rubrobacter tropicus]|uniref:Sulfotransferase n=1 Tax=Rubrobacter tropicus TaxID=2653851 RepID=A0A6G8QD98_9ACTN|nr:sulfotransferase [Rubrobacter tropicus]QIN84371.1 sulfotransferase [Rubrobacter tropicus]
MTMPNFFMVGAQKAGTTSLYHYLNQHPQVYMSPVKEPFFFNHEINADHEIVEREFGGPARRRASRFTNLDEYRALFENVTGESAVGEASTLYMYAPGTAGRIKKYASQARVIALLRNPADRAYSSFLHARRLGVEPLAHFSEALRSEEERRRQSWRYVFHYRNLGFYHAQLEPYYELFGQEKVGIFLYEDLRDDPTGVARGVFRLLGVDDGFVPDTSRKHNPSGVPKSRAARAAVKAMDAVAAAFLESFSANSRLYPFASRVRRRAQGLMLAKPEAMDPEIRAELLDGYEEDILKLEELTGRDLSVWLHGRKKPAYETGTKKFRGS